MRGVFRLLLVALSLGSLSLPVRASSSKSAMPFPASTPQAAPPAMSTPAPSSTQSAPSAPTAVPFSTPFTPESQPRFSSPPATLQSPPASMPPLRDAIPTVNRRRDHFRIHRRSAPPANQEPAVTPGAKNNAPAGSVESFFQLTPFNVAHPPSARSAPDAVQAGSQEENKFSAGRFLWHVLDNAGVPLPVRDTSGDLDPTLRNGYALPARAHDIIEQKADSTAASKPAQTDGKFNQTLLDKIPRGELEGTDYSMINETQTAAPAR